MHVAGCRKHGAPVETMVSMKDQLLSMREVAARTGLAVNTLHHMRMRGRGPASFRLGNRVRVRESALDAWLAEQEAQEKTRLDRIAG
jgi:excisionase family DNA binding protein